MTQKVMLMPFTTLMLIVFCLSNCNVGKDVQNAKSKKIENLSLIGEWLVDAVKSKDLNRRGLKHSKIIFENNASVSLDMREKLHSLDKSIQLNLGISDIESLVFLESGSMIQFPLTCNQSKNNSAPKIPFGVFKNISGDKMILFSVPGPIEFMITPLVEAEERIFLSLNPETKLYLKKSEEISLNFPPVHKNDLDLENLKGNVKSITIYSYDGSEFEPTPYGNIKSTSHKSFDESGNCHSQTLNTYGYRSEQITSTFSGSFSNKKISTTRRGRTTEYSLRRITKGDTVIIQSDTYSYKSIYIRPNMKEAIQNDYKDLFTYDNIGNVITKKTTHDDGGFYTKLYDYNKCDQNNNWLMQSSYDVTHCDPQRDGVTIRKIEYY